MSRVPMPEDYDLLQRIADDEPVLVDILNRNGAANLTVCPECHIDDFVHVEGCPLILEENVLEDEDE